MKFGYARVSTTDQNLDRQIDALTKAGCKKIYSEKLSGRNSERPELLKLLSKIHEEDEVVVQDLDRLGRNSKDLTAMMDKIRSKGATFNVLSLPTFEGVQDQNLKMLLNNLIIEIYKYQAEAEWRKIRERQRQGIAIAKEKGIYKGRPKKYAADFNDPTGRFLYQQTKEMLARGISTKEISDTLGIGRATVYRIQKVISSE